MKYHVRRIVHRAGPSMFLFSLQPRVLGGCDLQGRGARGERVRVRYGQCLLASTAHTPYALSANPVYQQPLRLGHPETCSEEREITGAPSRGEPEGHELIPYCLRLQSLRTSGSLVSSETHKNCGRRSGEYHLRRKLRLPRVAQPRCERDGRRQAGDSKTHMLLLNREVLSETELLPKSPIPLETFVVRRHLLHQKLPKGKNTGCLDLGFPNLSVIILGAHWALSLFPRQ